MKIIILEKPYENVVSYVIVHRSKHMTKASFMRNMDVCAVEENEVINTSPKKTTLALVTMVQKKAKSKKNLGSKCFSF